MVRYLHSFPVDVNGLDGEVHSYRISVFFHIGSVFEPLDDTRLAHRGVAYQDHFEQVVKRFVWAGRSFDSSTHVTPWRDLQRNTLRPFN